MDGQMDIHFLIVHKCRFLSVLCLVIVNGWSNHYHYKALTKILKTLKRSVLTRNIRIDLPPIPLVLYNLKIITPRI